eukprot:TRINITY_DN141_c0_g1_i1.p1 TRINITY_DN141_c0_g1~~TRINITY_DN141_c0_g1_i1.p1  ORF type:complete len:566 (+),score=209.81 TRINITY_DN141_c0_g1_i1:23-1699(+)
MAKKKSKGKSGAAVTYITRRQAMKKLQLSLPVFRKLCILKGVYPRAPSKTLKGRDKTYYHVKDILFLSHDPLIKKFRNFKTWKKKMRKAIAKEETGTVARLRRDKPAYKLDHVVRERFPTFLDALRDLDDAVCMIQLFATLPQNDKIKEARVSNCARLRDEFFAYVAHTNSLRKVFVSIKGIYYQADIQGEVITWLSPFEYPQKLPRDVDFRVMLSFLEFYECLMAFVNYKLYHNLGLVYPPKLKENSQCVLDNAAKLLAAEDKSYDDEELEEDTEEKEATAMEVVEGDGEKAVEVEVFGNPNESDETFRCRKVFDGCVFFTSREVPQRSIEFVIRSFGGAMCDDESSDTITHFVIDRPTVRNPVKSREYIQPQWVYDSVNEKAMLPVGDYAVGKKLPAHLSPFVDDEAEGYIPERRDALNKIAQGILPTGEKLAKKKRGASTNDDDDDAMEKRYEEELAAEQSGVAYSTKKKKMTGKRKQAPVESESEEEEEEDDEDDESGEEEVGADDDNDEKLRSIMIEGRKNRRLYTRIKHSQRKKQEKNSTLMKKRKAAAGKA